MSGAPTIESNGIELKAKLNPDFATVVSPEALELVAKLHRAFEPRRQELLKKRVELAIKLDAGQKLDFLPETKLIRDGDWNEIFTMTEQELGIKHGSIKATVLVETINATFEMDEILYELRDHSAGLNAGRWDYIFSAIKKFKLDKNFCLADRVKVTMTSPFMRSYALFLLKTCHKRGAPAMGGMSAFIPIKNDPEKNAIALAAVSTDKRREATDGYDGSWVAHPGLVELCMNEFKAVLGDKGNQFDRQRDDIQVTAADILNFAPEGPITEAGLRYNINVGIHYMGAWLAGNGCVPIHNLMEDAATAEISRSQVWQWIRSPKGVLDDGRKVTIELVRKMIGEELNKVKDSGAVGQFDRAAKIFDDLVANDQFVEFLTLPLYEEF